MRDVVQIVSLLVGVVVVIANLRSESKRQSDQHAELKQVTAARFDSLGHRIDGLAASISTIMADSREHSVRIDNLENRVSRAEGHLDNFGRLVFDGGRKKGERE